MARKPVHLMPAGRISNRDAIWTAIRALKRFTPTTLYLKVVPRVKPRTIEEYLTGLKKAGYLVVDGIEQGEKAWILARDVGVDAPRVRRDGTEVTQGRAQTQMWRTLRIIGDCDFHELAIAASTEECAVEEIAAKSYLRYLCAAGYVAQAYAGAPNRPSRYRLIPTRYSGPKAPMVQRVKQVFDPNLGKVVWAREVGGDELD